MLVRINICGCKCDSLTVVDSQNPALDFRNPESFYHDVNSVTGLLKQFFRDLPDPILTSEHHGSFIEAASTSAPSLAVL